MPTDSKNLLQKILKDNGYSLTKPRQLVCEFLQDNDPLAMRELVNKAGGRIDRASLYRTVALFEKLGIVQRIYIGWKYKIELSDIFTHHHHHISCLKCGKIVAITEEDKIEQLIANLAAKHNFVAQNHQLEIRGLCPNCQTTS
jgi:Fur family transcriptional regulator, ferric uptake regulator